MNFILLTEQIEMLPEKVIEEVQQVIEPTAIQKYLNELPAKALSLGIRVLFAILVFFIGSKLISIVRKIIRKSMTKANADKGVCSFVDSFTKMVLYILLCVMLASYFGVDAASIVALVGSAGVAIGLAIQGSLSNLAGGVLILLLKPFSVGDYIIDSGTGKEGTVTDIRIFHTSLTTFDNQVVVLPNGNLSNSAITNLSKEKTRRLDIPVSISYQSDIKTAQKALLEMLSLDPGVLNSPEAQVVVDKLADSGIELIVRFWTLSGDYWPTKYRVTESIKYCLDAAGIEIPFPQMDVHMK